MPSYKLTYFDGKGRGENARLMFVKAGVAFEDKRITFEEWGALKPTTPYGSLPVLEVDGVAIGQSFTIVNFLAKQFGLLGDTDIEAALVNGICQSLDDLNDAVISAFFNQDEAKKATAIKDLKETKIPGVCNNLKRIMEKHGSGFLVGSKMTAADIYFSNYIDGTKIVGIEADLSAFPKLKEVKAKVEADPKIAEWIKKRPVTPF